MKRYKNMLMINAIKAIILLVIFVGTSCDAEMYIDPADSSKTHFSPPSWIIGTWLGEKSDSIVSPNYEIFEFTQGNFIVSNYGDEYSPAINFNRHINGSSWKPEVLYELKKNNEYEIVIKSLATTSSYRFVKISDTEIMYHYIFNKDHTEPEGPYRLRKMN